MSVQVQHPCNTCTLPVCFNNSWYSNWQYSAYNGLNRTDSTKSFSNVVLTTKEEENHINVGNPCGSL